MLQYLLYLTTCWVLTYNSTTLKAKASILKWKSSIH
ncbi:hypothetical protein OOU_Y34scaffold00726g9 [Pyricularia oryzae Y34]|uniref:Uncharacterized protein n=2 Tax=Pyricularia oryzae TaxID=318829 RepID=A0AA97NRM0_PYRO3|nr:hypothetical protein OOU_Y34scaffold00726g9 [Pyricularia oryzae Y34]